MCAALRDVCSSLVSHLAAVESRLKSREGEWTLLNPGAGGWGLGPETLASQSPRGLITEVSFILSLNKLTSLGLITQ